MASLTQILSWFGAGKKPTASQFAQAWGSFRNNGDAVPIGDVNGLSNALNQKADLVSTQNQLSKKADLDSNGFVVQSQINTANLGIVGAANPATNPGVPTTAVGYTLSNTNAVLAPNGDGSRNTANDIVYPNFPTAQKDGSGNPIPITLFPQTFGVARYNLTTQAWDFQAMPLLNQPSAFEIQVKALSPKYYNRLSAVGAQQPAVIGLPATLNGASNLFQQSTVGSRIGCGLIGSDARLDVPVNLTKDKMCVCAIVNLNVQDYTADQFISNFPTNFNQVDWKTTNGAFVGKLTGFWGLMSTLYGGIASNQNAFPSVQQNTSVLVVFNLSSFSCEGAWYNGVKQVGNPAFVSRGQSFFFDILYMRGTGHLIMSDLMVFDRFLSDGEVSALYNSLLQNS